MSHALLSTTLAVLALTLALAGAARAELTLHVAVDGDDAATGSATDPLASLEGARDRIRQLRAEGADDAFVVEVAAGEYAMAGPLRLSSEDGGARRTRDVRAQAGRRCGSQGDGSPAELVTDEGSSADVWRRGLLSLPTPRRWESAIMAALSAMASRSSIARAHEHLCWLNEGFCADRRVLARTPST